MRAEAYIRAGALPHCWQRAGRQAKYAAGRQAGIEEQEKAEAV